jgi:hypothetical protein
MVLAFKKFVGTQTHAEFVKSGMHSPKDPRYAPFCEVSTKLLSSETKTISNAEVVKICSESGVPYEVFRESNVFAFHIDDSTVSFQSRACETYASDKMNK